MNELTMEERNSKIWFKEDTKYAIVLMYSVGRSEPRFVRAGPMYPDTVLEKLEKMLNDVEQGRFVCINSQFVNPRNVIGIKVDAWKDMGDRRDAKDGEFYD